MEDGSWSQVSEMLSALGSQENARANLREWRNAEGWTLDALAENLATASPKVALGRQALHKIERGERQVTVDEALALSRLFGRSLADFLLPPESLDWQPETWRSFDRAVRRMLEIREASVEYAALISIIRRALPNQPALEGFIAKQKTLAEEIVRADNSPTRRQYEAEVKAASASKRESPPFEQWMLGIEPSPMQVAARHALSRVDIDADHWYLGWETNTVRSQFKLDRDAKLRAVAPAKRGVDSNVDDE